MNATLRYDDNNYCDNVVVVVAVVEDVYTLGFATSQIVKYTSSIPNFTVDEEIFIYKSMFSAAKSYQSLAFAKSPPSLA